MDLAELQDAVMARGYTHDFGSHSESLSAVLTSDLSIVESFTFDAGTDPGDDVTIYLIESSRGQKGYLILPDSFHSDPQKAAFISALLANTSAKR